MSFSAWYQFKTELHPDHLGQGVPMGFSSGSVVKNPPVNARDMGSTPGSRRRPGGGNGNPLRYPLLGKFHGQRSLVGYSPWGHKELDMTEQLNTPVHTYVS
ncbi:unnamed protein product [Rangifer tarandus platyrhynchus]|uniref:Uncharacterized protein n=1 Tax=Rangifer tarandus platyrhynchus TaxID=3082113 RepID=A0ABN8ZNI5_RANTA|nr:unnamed protein product [Rangifer tarandus platyrhynchus]